MPDGNLGEDLGRIFEVGFNLGVYHYLSSRRIACASLRLHERHLARHDTHRLVGNFARRWQSLTPEDDDLLHRTGVLFLWKGFLGGHGLIDQHIGVLNAQSGGRDIDIPAYICSFVGANELVNDYDEGGARARDEEMDRAHLRLLLGGDTAAIAAAFDAYRGAGQFLRADTLLHIRTGHGTRKERHHILCVDLSVLSVRSPDQLADLRTPEGVRHILTVAVARLRRRSVFSALTLDDGAVGGHAYLRTADFARYIYAFVREDRESMKVVQAASYVLSFYRFLSQHHLIPDSCTVQGLAVGHSDRATAALSVRLGGEDGSDEAMLRACQNLYRTYRARSNAIDGARVYRDAVQRARADVLAAMRDNARRVFGVGGQRAEGRAFVDRLYDLGATAPSGAPEAVEYTETLDHFANSCDPVPDELAASLSLEPGLDLRGGHRALVYRAMSATLRYLFLTGNAGIGKTTALAEYLKGRAREGEGFLFFYASPRTQVNLDIFEKFRERDGRFFDPRFVGLTSNSQMIKANANQATVGYVTDGHDVPPVLADIAFQPMVEGADSDVREVWQDAVHRATDDMVTDWQGYVPGVLASLCRGIGALMDARTTPFIASSVAIQSHKTLASGRSTLGHVLEIFRSALNKDTPIPDRMRALATAYRHVVIMVDEVTGDDSGTAFLHELIGLLDTLGLERYGFNVKVVVADASIVGPDIIATHLTHATPEPDKVFFRAAVAGEADAALSSRAFRFKSKGHDDAVAINANSYPASELSLGYKIFVEPIEITQEMMGRRGQERRPDAAVRDRAYDALVDDICAFLQTHRGTPTQLIVYIQDKSRLQDLIDDVRMREGERGHAFDERDAYLQIHSQVSREDKLAINEHKDAVRVVFMTSSASRGLSFPNTRSILVEVPHFDIEANLMEIMQVVYRGRGGDDAVARSVTFYFGEPAYYSASDREWSLTQSALHVINMLILLKLCLLTRIRGAGEIRGRRYVVVPVGGKSVSRAGASVHHTMGRLVKDLADAWQRDRSDTTPRDLRGILRQTFGEMMACVQPSGANDVSLLGLLHRSTPTMLLDLLAHGGVELRRKGLLERGFVAGELLVVPADAVSVTHVARLDSVIQRHLTPSVRAKMWAIVHNKKRYPDGLRTGLRDFASIVDEFMDADRTQHLAKVERRDDMYYAVPMLAYVARELLQGEWHTTLDDDSSVGLRDLLVGQVHPLYPSENYLPLGGDYGAFPFILFTSHDLRSIREKMHTGRYMLMSTELNLLDMLLAQPEP